jgi:hypothetical protein
MALIGYFFQLVRNIRDYKFCKTRFLVLVSHSCILILDLGFNDDMLYFLFSNISIAKLYCVFV